MVPTGNTDCDDTHGPAIDLLPVPHAVPVPELMVNDVPENCSWSPQRYTRFPTTPSTSFALDDVETDFESFVADDAH